MYRSIFDTDVTTWAPAGKVYQIEYAMKAVDQGTVCVGAKSNRHVVLGALKRAPSKIAGFLDKIELISDNCALAFSGLSGDGKKLANHMRNDMMAQTTDAKAPIFLNKIMERHEERIQTCTQKSDKRPFGVGLIVGGMDANGSHLYHTFPSGRVAYVYATTMGARSQSAKRYLEKRFESFPECSLDELYRHVLSAMLTTLTADYELKPEAIDLGTIVPNQGWAPLSDENKAQLIAQLQAVRVAEDSEMHDATAQ